MNKNELLKIANEHNATSIVEKYAGLEKENFKTRVAFLGEFSSGKTSLVNSLLKTKFLPCFDKPTTAIVTEVKKGESLSFSVSENIGGLETQREIEIVDLAEEVQKDGKNRVLNVEINDSDLLDDNTIIIDTPGVSSINESHSKITYGYLPNMDVVFMVVNINMGSVSKSLQQFLQNCPENIIDKIHFVLNFKDTKSPKQIEKLVSEFTNSLTDFVKEVKVIVASSKEALIANDNDDKEKFIKSGVQEIENIIKNEIPKLHDEIAENRYFSSLNAFKEELIFFLEESEKNLSLDKTSFYKKIESLKADKKELEKNKAEIIGAIDDVEITTTTMVTKLNDDYVLNIIGGLSNNMVEPVIMEYSNELTSLLENQLLEIEDYDLPESFVNKLALSTQTNINNKVGTLFQITNKLPSMVNAAGIAIATGGAGAVANIAEYAILQGAGKALELAEKHVGDNKEVKDLISETATSANGKFQEKKKQIPPVAMSKKRKTIATIFTILEDLNVTEFAKNKVMESTQKSKISRILNDNSKYIIQDVFKGVFAIINKQIEKEIVQPMKLKENAIAEVEKQLSSSVKELEDVKSKISGDLVVLYKIS